MHQNSAEAAREYFKDPQVRAEFEAWKAERGKKVSRIGRGWAR